MPTSTSESPIRTSRQFNCTELKLGELSQPSSKKHKYSQTVVYTRYSLSVGRIPPVTIYYEIKQTSFQLEKKLGKDVGNGWDIHSASRQTASRGKP
ncbi:unnamed protein product [Schistosoma mattheei]|uniref:Uncharacterized protein n=1 Tax=Schistosoma mattheei TaxID=31246 RepID=A0A183NQI5_9TREM|nr:unnamed protein product [Schistosoma mattheei]